MQIEKAQINDRLGVSKVSWNFCIPVIFNLTVIYPWNLLFSSKKMKDVPKPPQCSYSAFNFENKFSERRRFDWWIPSKKETEKKIKEKILVDVYFIHT